MQGTGAGAKHEVTKHPVDYVERRLIAAEIIISAGDEEGDSLLVHGLFDKGLLPLGHSCTNASATVEGDAKIHPGARRLSSRDWCHGAAPVCSTGKLENCRLIFSSFLKFPSLADMLLRGILA